MDSHISIDAKLFLQIRVLIVLATAAVGFSQLEVAKPAPNAVKTNSKDGLTYVWIPAGTFVMGCSVGDGACENSEKPAHKVAITKGFWIGQTEVTQAAYERVVGENPSSVKGASLPIDGVTWRNARDYCAATGMRLPTEAEWEDAARGGTNSARYGKLDAVAWYSANSGGQIHEVGKKQANAYGLYDMLGNAAEWVADWYDESYYASAPTIDPKGPDFGDELEAIKSGHEKVFRGAAASAFYRDTRASQRHAASPAMSIVGFRCAGN